MKPALRGVSFTLRPRQRLDIVGRTGSGKTSLTSAFLRFIDSAQGSIIIDDLDISTVPLVRLRNAITIISQDPFLFSGTLRSNLDLHGDRPDKELHSALRRVHLNLNNTKIEERKFLNLDMDIRPGGVNLSDGQRQLVCLARALLAQSRILILDEPTSAIDSVTDALIQQVIRQEFSEATILVVAHRLTTVTNFDSILVLHDGEVVEFGSPAELLIQKGMFWDMCTKGGRMDYIM